MTTIAEQKAWDEAQRIYERGVTLLEANMDRRDIDCQTYQRMKIHANRSVGLEHGPHCDASACICGGFPYGKCIHDVSTEENCEKCSKLRMKS
jgi:hypothetical protein